MANDPSAPDPDIPTRPLSMKSKDKLPASSLKRPTRKKPKDKPKRPLSAYNFFFKEEREKILKLVLNEDPDVKNEPDSDDYINDEMMKRLKKEGGKVSFEEMGKLIGQRWKKIDPDRLSKYSEMAAEDTERYKKEMQTYNGRQEAKMRSEALKPPAWSGGGGSKDAFGASAKAGSDPARAALPAVQSAYNDMAAAAAMQGFNPAAAMQGYGAYGMDMNAYAAMGQMGAMYGYGGYGMANPAMAGGDMQGQFAPGMYGQMAMMGGAGFGGMMGYGAAQTAAAGGVGVGGSDPTAAAAQAAASGGFPNADLYVAQAAGGGGAAGQPQGGAGAPNAGQWGGN